MESVLDVRRNRGAFDSVRSMSQTPESVVRIAALGDLMLAGEWTGYQEQRRLEEALGDLAHLRKRRRSAFRQSGSYSSRQ